MGTLQDIAGRPRNRIEFNESFLEKIRAYAAAQLTLGQIADMLRITDLAFSELRARFPAIDAEIRANRAVIVINVSNKLVDNAMNGDVQAQKFFLQCKGGWTPAEKNIVEQQSYKNSAKDLDKILSVEEAKNIYTELLSSGDD